MNRPIHFEIHAANPERAMAFYSGLLDWKFTKWDSPMPYWLIQTGDPNCRGIDGGLMGRMGPERVEMQPTNSWLCTVDVVDVVTAVAKAVELGGTVAVPKMPITGVGWLAYVKDTEGNIFGLMENDPAAK